MTSKMTDEKIAALVAKELERRELESQARILTDEKVEQISAEIAAVQLTHGQLAIAVRAVIPDEEPHKIVLQAMLDWIYVAQAAKLGSLRHQRHALLPYTREEIADFASDSEMMEFPCDFQTLISGLEMEEPDALISREKQRILFNPRIVPVVSVVFGMVATFVAMYVMGRIF
jgi:hypothetical protein